MKFIEFKKYFFDIFSQDSNYLVVFISILRIWKIHSCFIQIHYAGPGPSGIYELKSSMKSRLKLIQDRPTGIKFFEGAIFQENGTLAVNLNIDEYKVDLKYLSFHPDSIHSEPFIIKKIRNNSIMWQPLQIKGLVNGSIKNSENTIEFRDEYGYTDLVQSSIFPVTIHIRKLFWGRLHHENIDLTYSLIVFSNNESRGVIKLYYNNRFIEFKDPGLIFLEEKINPSTGIVFPDKLMISAKNSGNNIILEIYNHRELIINEFMDPTDQYNKLFSGIVKFLSKNPRGLKFLAHADLQLEHDTNKSNFKDLILIDEFVVFYD